MPGAFKLDHLQPIQPILSGNFSIFFTFILGSQILLPQRANNGEKGNHLALKVDEREGFQCLGLSNWTICISGRPKALSAVFLPKIFGRNLAERHFVIFFAFRLFCRKTMFRQKGLLSAERLSFGRNVRLNLDLIQKRSRILSWITEYLAKH